MGGNTAHFRGQTAGYQSGWNVEFVRGPGATFWLQDKGTRPTDGGLRLWKDSKASSVQEQQEPRRGVSSRATRSSCVFLGGLCTLARWPGTWKLLLLHAKAGGVRPQALTLELLCPFTRHFLFVGFLHKDKITNALFALAKDWEQAKSPSRRGDQGYATECI